MPRRVARRRRQDLALPASVALDGPIPTLAEDPGAWDFLDYLERVGVDPLATLLAPPGQTVRDFLAAQGLQTRKDPHR